jgi:hypothetical protein
MIFESLSKSAITANRRTLHPSLKDVKIVFIKHPRRGWPTPIVDDKLLAEMKKIPELRTKVKPREITDKENIGNSSSHSSSSTNKTRACTFDVLSCECCFDDEVAFDNIVQCQDGHLFCITCIEHHINEQVFGKNLAVLQCVSQDGCSAAFSREVLCKLPSKTVQAFDEMEARECIQAANLPNLQ